MQRNLRSGCLIAIPAFGAILFFGFWVLSEWNFQRGMNHARQVLPEAQSILDSNSKYSRVQVEVSDAEGGSLWFSGNMASQNEADAMEALLEEQLRCQIIFVVFSDEPATVNSN